MQKNKFLHTILFVLFLALVGASIFGFEKKNKPKNQIQENASYQKDIKTEVIQKSQNINWQKQLEDILNGDATNNKDKNTQATTTKFNTLSAKVSEKLIEQYFSLKAESGTTTKTDLQEISNQAANEIIQETISNLPKYDKSDIKKTFLPTKEKVFLYKNLIRKAMYDLQHIDEYELKMINDYIKSGDIKKLDKIHKTGLYYKTAYQNLLKVPVPEDFIAEHIAFVNALSGISYALENFPEYKQDPILAYALLGIYMTHERALLNISKKMELYFQKYDVK